MRIMCMYDCLPYISLLLQSASVPILSSNLPVAVAPTAGAQEVAPRLTPVCGHERSTGLWQDHYLRRAGASVGT